MKACSFFGHRNIRFDDNHKEKLKRIIKNLIQNKNFSTFYFGEFGNFDDVCYEIVTELKAVYSHIERVYVATDERALSKHKKSNEKYYERQIIFLLKFNWWYQIIYYRNIAIIDNSDFVIFYVENKNNSGAYKALQYAKKNKKSYINIAQVNNND